MRGILLAKGPDSSVGGLPVGCCPDEVQMEEGEAQVKVQVEEEEIGETHAERTRLGMRREQTIKSHTWMTMRMR